MRRAVMARPSIVLPALAALLLSAFVLRLFVGPSETPWTDLMLVLSGRHEASGSADLLFEFRLPQAIAAVLAGSALALSGLQMQTVFHNPLAGPWALGLIAGAQLGVAVLIVSGSIFGLHFSGALGPTSLSGISFAAALGAFVALLLALALARHVSAATLLVCGLLFAATLDGVRGFLIHLVGVQYELLFLSWDQAGFGGVTWHQLRVFAVVVGVGILLALALAKNLNGLLLGEQYARSIGVSVAAVRRAALLSTLLLAGSATAFSGAVLFIDLAVAHFCRGVFRTADHRLLVPAAALVGAAMALTADIAVVLMPGDERLPVNIMTCLLGGPVVLWVLLRGDRTVTS
jgi:iron complex transport system permease protein